MGSRYCISDRNEMMDIVWNIHRSGYYRFKRFSCFRKKHNNITCMVSIVFACTSFYFTSLKSMFFSLEFHITVWNIFLQHSNIYMQYLYKVSSKQTERWATQVQPTVPLVSFGHYIVYLSSIYGFWLSPLVSTDFFLDAL
jgi:hypothetical protein